MRTVAIRIHPMDDSEENNFTPLERIKIQQNEHAAFFRIDSSRTPFFVRGFNYIRLRSATGYTGGDHSTFEADTETTRGCYDPEQADQMLAHLNAAGFNTVRVFIIGRNSTNPGIAGNFASTGAVYEPYLDNVIDFLKRATRYGIRVLPVFGDGEIPRNAYYQKLSGERDFRINALILTVAGIAARVEHITSFLSYIKEKCPAVLATIFALSCQNEAHLRADQWPFNATTGEFTAANGKTYDLSDAESRQALMDDGYRHYHDSIVTAVKRIDPDILVTEGVFVPRAVGKDGERDIGLWPGRFEDERYPPTVTTLDGGPLDFIDVHLYRTDPAESVEEAFTNDLRSTVFVSSETERLWAEKPVILGEFGEFRAVESDFKRSTENMAAVRDMALDEGFQGMLFWTYDCFEQEYVWHAAQDWPHFISRLGNFLRPSGS